MNWGKYRGRSQQGLALQNAAIDPVLNHADGEEFVSKKEGGNTVWWVCRETRVLKATNVLSTLG